MNPQFQQIIAQAAVREKKKAGKTASTSTENYRRAKARYRFKKTFSQNIRNAIMILIGISSAAFGLKSFILPNNFIDGGATGISLLVAALSNQSLSLIIILVNIPFIIIGYHQMGQSFAIRTMIAILGLAIVLALVPFPMLTEDKLLVSVFGGFFLGAGIGFAMRGGAVLDGTEVLAIYLSRKTSASIGDVIMVINVVIFSAAAKLLSIETALYSMLAYLAASKTVDFLIEGIEEYTGFTIISPKNTEISVMIAEKLGRGVTVYNGKGGYGKRGYSSNANTNILFTVVTRLEISKLQSEIDIIDPNAFVVMHSIKDTRGGMIKKRPMAH
ncbi:MAG: YitT family protein [Chitinophagaceae bacterium]|nr:YitT family protein [Chitinophagaceae bacterium]